MSEEVKKIVQVNDDAKPEFPISRRGGYLEEAVDKWLTAHYEELAQIIAYQNYTVDVLEAKEAELADVAPLLEEAERRTVEAEERAAKAEQDLADARNNQTVAAPVQETPAPVAAATPVTREFSDEIEEEAYQASALLQRASRLAREHVEAAESDAVAIRENAENSLVSLREEIEQLKGIRFATYRALSNFYETELSKLREDDRFSGIENENITADADVVVENVTVEETPDEEAVVVEDFDAVDEADESTTDEAETVEVDSTEVDDDELSEEDKDESHDSHNN
jgi:hypothetical protein